MKRLLAILVVLVVSAGAYFLSVAGNKAMKTGGPHYYSSFKTKSLPEVPLGEITELDAKRNAQKSSYYVAYFDEKGRLTKFEKYLQGKIEWTSEYTYDSNGKLTRGRNIESGGSETQYEFDGSGAVAKTIESKGKGR